MIDLIQQHLDAIEQIQSDLEQKIKQALGDVTPQDILERAHELPEEIASELRDWIEQFVLQDLVDESRRFLHAIDDESDEDVIANEDKIRHMLIVLFDGYIQTITIAATAALADIKNAADSQVALGRAIDAIIAELNNGKAGIGARLKAFERKIIVETDSFISSGGGIVPIAASQELAWVTVEDKKVCDDCDKRHGEVRPAAEWVDMGLPRTGWSVCTGYCRCVLVPASAFERFGKPGPVNRPRRK